MRVMRLRELHILVSFDEVCDSSSSTSELLVFGALPAGDTIVHLSVDREREASVN